VGIGSGLEGTGRAITGGTPRIGFSGYNLGSAGNTPQRTGEKNYSIRDDLTTSYNAMGRHDVSFGAEFIYYTMPQNWCNLCDGVFASNQRPPANLEQLLPVWDDVSSWNLNALSPLMRDFTISIGEFRWKLNRQIFASWLQDDWRVNDRLTMNLGVRWESSARTRRANTRRLAGG
jgi:outer membrane receptor protein involved in Fe transport